MSEQTLDSLGQTIAGTFDNAETRLIAELTDCQQDNLVVSRTTLRNSLRFLSPRQSDLPDGYRELVKAAEIGQAKAETVNVKLKAHRRAKLRKRDLHDLSDLRAAINDLAGEIDATTHADNLYRKHWGHSPEANAVYQQRRIRLQIIREKLAKLRLVMDSVDGNPITNQQIH